MEDSDDPLPYLLSVFNFSSPSIFFGLAAIVLLLFCSAFISGAEVAFFSISPKEENELKSSRLKKDSLILAILQYPKRLLATILIANNFVNVGIVILSSYIANVVFSFSDTLLFGIEIAAQTQEFVVLVVLVTFMILLAGEVIPKVYANKYPLKLARIMAYPVFVMEKVFWWIGISRFLIFSTSIIHKKVMKKSNNISVDDLSHALDLTDETQVSKEDHKILKGIVRFGNTDVKQIMQPRVDVAAIEYETKFLEVLEKIIDAGYSRVPVYRESFDKIEGVLFIKDLLPWIHEPDAFNWQILIREPYFVPESKKIDDLLKEFQERRMHLAIVVDEYGGNSGIITLEDILEEIVGDITDEFDEEDLVFSKLDEFNIVFEGKTPLKDLYRILEIEGDDFEEKKGESDTIAGFLLELSGKIMKKNEKINFDNYTFTIEAADKRRIKRVKVTINEPKIEKVSS